MRICLLSYLLLFSATAKPASLQQVNSAFPMPSEIIIPGCFEEGQNQLDNGNWKSALQAWKKAFSDDSCFDTQVAQQFIETTIEHNAYPFYSFAEYLYFNMLNEAGRNQNYSILKTEALLILPLLDEDVQKQWKEKIDKNDFTLEQDIIRFWKLRDPVLSTSNNERLAEHWQRIAHARKEFSKNKNSVFATDDRGTIYVRLGEPTFKRSGLLNPESTEIRSKLYDLSYHKGGISPQEMFNLSMSIKQQYMPTRYEVWVYRNLEPGSRQSVLYIFGNSADRGTFGLRKSVEEFIPSGSYRMGIAPSGRYGTGPRGLNAGPFLQMALYNALSTIDIYFGRQLTYYDDNWYQYMNGNLNFSALKMMNSSFRAERELLNMQKQAPEYFSSLEKRLGYVEQFKKVYRFLNDQNEPVYRLMVFAAPDERLLPRDARINQHQQPAYRTQHFLKIYDKNASVSRSIDSKAPLRTGASTVQAGMFEIPAETIPAKPGSILLSSEIHRLPKLNSTKWDSTNREVRVIIGSVVTQLDEIPAPLKTNRDSMEVSDIIWGYGPGKKNHQIDNIPFIIPHDSEIPSGKNLMVYFETYLSQTNGPVVQSYQTEYQIFRRKRRNRLKDRGIKIKLNFKTAASVAKEHFEIKTEELEPGKYRAIFRFGKEADIDSSTGIERTIDFEIE